MKRLTVLLFIGGIAGYVFFLSDGVPNPSIDLGVLLGLVVSVLWSIGLRLVDKAKSRSPRLIGHNHNTSLGRGPITFTWGQEDWFLFRRGGYISSILPVNNGDEGIVLVPQALTDRFSGNYVLLGVPQRRSLEKLPEFAQRYIMEGDISPPYYVASIPISRLIEDLDIDLKKTKDVEEYLSGVDETLSLQQQQISRLQTLLNQGFESLESVADQIGSAFVSLGGNRGILQLVKDKTGLKKKRQKEEY